MTVTAFLAKVDISLIAYEKLVTSVAKTNG